MGYGRTVGMVMAALAVPAMLGGCTSIRKAMGYEVQPPPIVEEHLTPCKQPSRSAPQRNCGGTIVGYNPAPALKKQEF